MSDAREPTEYEKFRDASPENAKLLKDAEEELARDEERLRLEAAVKLLRWVVRESSIKHSDGVTATIEDFADAIESGSLVVPEEVWK